MVEPINQPNLKLLPASPLMRGLLCAALQPGLRNILIFDAEPIALRSLASVFAQMLEQTTGQEIAHVQLGSNEAEDDLWGRLTVSPVTHLNQRPIGWKPGLLGVSQPNELRLIVIPDLTQLSLAAIRACVTVMDAEVVHLERHGQQQVWLPDLCWIAGCSKEKIGAVSPHLLDRFALRLTGKAIPQRDHVSELLAKIEGRSLEPRPQLVSSEIAQLLQQSTQSCPEMLASGFERVGEYLQSLTVSSARRDIGLSRLAFAWAQLEGSEQVTETHVDEAAQIIGLQPPQPEEDFLNEDPSETGETPSSQPQENEEDDRLDDWSLFRMFGSEAQTISVFASEQTDSFEAEPLEVYERPDDPYPEDRALVDRDATSLKRSPSRFRAKVNTQGVAVGVEPVSNPNDLALVSTLLESAKFQTIRRRRPQWANQNPDTTTLILSPTDLRGYRRVPVAEKMLALVLDYTCLKECNWREALLPYLNWAYQERASVCLVQVGVQRTLRDEAHCQNGGTLPDELQARKIVERSILVPRITAGIDALPGRATPLAHGLELALQTLRHALQHGRSRVWQALLVVISDGRGNIPLEGSHNGKVERPVKNQGVEDALRIAEQIQQLDHVDVILLNPQPIHHPELPLNLAKALQARVVDILPSLETLVVEGE